MHEAVALSPDLPELSFDDLRPGAQLRLGTFALSREAAIAFARLYDPEPFHLDDEAAAANPVFGRLSASGWQTALIMKMLLGEFVTASGLVGLAGGGVTNMSWPKPVFPPAVLRIDLEIVSARASATRPSLGIAVLRTTAYDPDHAIVGTMDLTGLFSRERAG